MVAIPLQPALGQRAGALHHLAQDGIDVQALADAQTRLAEFREALPQRLDVPLPGRRIPSIPLPPDSMAASTRGRVVVPMRPPDPKNRLRWDGERMSPIILKGHISCIDVALKST